MTRRSLKGFPGRLGPQVVADLPLDVQRARAEFLSDTSEQLGQLFRGGVRELADRNFARSGPEIVSLDAMAERGYQIDTDGNVYEPYDEDDE